MLTSPFARVHLARLAVAGRRALDGGAEPRDGHGNVLFGDAVAVDCERCIVVGEGGTAAALGLEDMVVVHVGDSTLACRLEETDRVRQVSEAVRERGKR